MGHIPLVSQDRRPVKLFRRGRGLPPRVLGVTGFLMVRKLLKDQQEFNS